jgi:hypothetical protein
LSFAPPFNIGFQNGHFAQRLTNVRRANTHYFHIPYYHSSTDTIVDYRNEGMAYFICCAMNRFLPPVSTGDSTLQRHRILFYVKAA